MSRKLARPTDEGDQDASFEVKGEYEKDEEDFGEYFDGVRTIKKAWHVCLIEMF